MKNEICIVSIITPIYNSSNYLENTINSVLSQSFKDWELLIVDDCSIDNSRDLIRRYCIKDNRIKLIVLNENSGAAVARNVAIKIAKGRYIAFLDADDIWLPSKLKKQIDFMKNNNIDFSYTAYERINEHGQVINTVGVPDRLSYTDLLKKCEIGCLTVIYDTRNLGKVYMPNIRKRQDLCLWLEILKKIPYAYGLNEVLAQYTVRKKKFYLFKQIKGSLLYMAGLS